jgi:hypothetical protein
VYFSLLLALLATQGPKLTSAEAGAITRTVVSYLIPPDKPVGSHQVVGRTVIFDRVQAIRAFRPLVGNVDERDIVPTLPALLMPRDSAVECVRATRDCTVKDNGIFLALDAVSQRDVRPGEYRVEVTLLYAEKSARGTSELHGGTYSLVLGLVGGKWKQWKVLRASHRPAH